MSLKQARTPKTRDSLRRWARMTLVALVVVAPQSVRAEDTSRPALTAAQKQQTKDHYEKATRLYNVEKYPEAIAEYEAAYLVSADPVMLFNIAQCYRRNDQPEEASRFYKNYLRNAPSAPNRGEVEKKITEMETLAADRKRQGLTPATPPPTALPAPAPPVPEPAPPAPPAPVEAPAPINPPAAVTAAPEAPPPPSRALPLTLTIGGGVLVATSVVFGLGAASKAKTVQDAAAGHDKVFDATLQKTQDDGKKLNAVAVATGLVGLAAGTIGIIMLVRRGPSESAPTALDVSPLFGGGLAGAQARVAF